MFRIIGFIVVSLLLSRLIGKVLLPMFFGNSKPPQQPNHAPEGTVHIQKNAPTNDTFTDYEEVK
jgi:hypothetical protein